MRFSVVTPVYNNALTLEATAKTVLAQTFADWEWVIVNDGSKDDSAAICDRLAKENPRIRVFHQPNGGVSVARNNAISCAKGDYIVPIDADDAFEPWALEYLDTLIRRFPEVEAIQTPCRERTLETWSDDAFSSVMPRPPALSQISGKEAFRELFVDPETRRQEWQPWRFSYRRDRAPHYTPGVIHEDLDTMPLYVRSLSRVCISPVPYYIYTVAREGSATQFFTPRRTRDMLNIMPRLWECEEFRPMLEWNLWGYYRATERLEGPERAELMAKFREHPEYLGLSRSDVGRHPGLEFARLAAMFLVVLQHVTLLGGLQNDGMTPFHRFQARLLESTSQCCVDVFGLLSGYVLASIGWRWKWRKFAGLWFQVFSTGLLVLSGCALFLSPTAKDWLQAALPLCFDEYWYFTGYLFVFLSAPLLAFAARKPWAKYAAAALFLSICGIAAFPRGDALLPLDGGYSAAWLVTLAFWGMVLKNAADGLKNVKRRVCLSLALLLIALTAGQRFVMSVMPSLKNAFADEWTLAHFTSPTIVLASAAFLLWCTRLDVGKRLHKLLYAVAPCAFGVYLLHVQPFFFEHVFKGRFVFLDSLPDALFGPAALAVAGLVFLSLLLVEKLRRKLFSLLHL